jgi:SAM-dependent methyltransferase
MLEHSHVVAPRAVFAVGVAETLPFANHVFDLMTAAGSLNYADLRLFFPEAARVLSKAGTLVIYDFSSGRRFRNGSELNEWFAEFEQRYPHGSGYALDVRAIDYAQFGLSLIAFQEFEIALPLTAQSYLEYVLTETNVESAIQRGLSEQEIRTWCSDGIKALFGDSTREVLFDGYVAYASH